MRRWLSILLLVFLPLQFSWAAVGVYCQHETGTQASHFGHHDHQHQAAPDQKGGAVPDFSAGIDNDCSACHAGCCSLVFFGDAGFSLTGPASPTLTGYQFRLPAPPPYPPERPNWVALA